MPFCTSKKIRATAIGLNVICTQTLILILPTQIWMRCRRVCTKKSLLAEWMALRSIAPMNLIIGRIMRSRALAQHKFFPELYKLASYFQTLGICLHVDVYAVFVGFENRKFNVAEAILSISYWNENHLTQNDKGEENVQEHLTEESIKKPARHIWRISILETIPKRYKIELKWRKSIHNVKGEWEGTSHRRKQKRANDQRQKSLSWTKLNRSRT